MKHANHHTKKKEPRTHYSLEEMQNMLGDERGLEMFNQGKNWIAHQKPIVSLKNPVSLDQ